MMIGDVGGVAHLEPLRYAIPTIYQFREYAQAGGLISYGIDNADAYRQTGVYTGLVLKGAKPADLPIMQETMVINIKTANALASRYPIIRSRLLSPDEPSGRLLRLGL